MIPELSVFLSVLPNIVKFINCLKLYSNMLYYITGNKIQYGKIHQIEQISFYQNASLVMNCLGQNPFPFIFFVLFGVEGQKLGQSN